MSEAVENQYKRVKVENVYVPDEVLGKALEAMSQAYSIYPDSHTSGPMIDCFNHDAQDAMDMGVLTEAQFDSYSDIGIMQKEWYVEEVLRNPFIAAIRSLADQGYTITPKPT